MPSTRYVGTELDVFAEARNWKTYVHALISPYLRGHVLEVGAGIGSTTGIFRTSAQDRWTALEPDPELASRMHARVAALAPPVRVVVGTLSAVRKRPLFDCVLYMDVLEHIADDRAELGEAASRLAPGGVIVVLGPAHQSLYTPFDAAIGHHRRYDRAQLTALTPRGTSLERLDYVDSFGLALVIGNKWLLRSAAPTVSQIRAWDRVVVPISRRLDRLFGGRIGKSVLAVWRRNDT